MGASSSSPEIDEKKIEKTSDRISDTDLRIIYGLDKKKRITRRERKEMIIEQIAKEIAMKQHFKELEKAKTLTSWKKSLYGYVPRIFKDPAHPSLEVFINVMLFALSYQVSWITWFLYFPDFRDIVVKAWANSDAKKVVIKYLTNAYMSGAVSNEKIMSMFSALITFTKVPVPIWITELANLGILKMIVEKSVAISATKIIRQ